jgi:hypothetical protein
LVGPSLWKREVRRDFYSDKTRPAFQKKRQAPPGCPLDAVLRAIEVTFPAAQKNHPREPGVVDLLLASGAALRRAVEDAVYCQYCGV